MATKPAVADKSITGPSPSFSFFFFLRILFRSYPTISVIRGRRRTFRRRKGASCKKTTAEEVRKEKKRNETKRDEVGDGATFFIYSQLLSPFTIHRCLFSSFRFQGRFGRRVFRATYFHMRIDSRQLSVVGLRWSRERLPVGRAKTRRSQQVAGGLALSVAPAARGPEGAFFFFPPLPAARRCMTDILCRPSLAVC